MMKLLQLFACALLSLLVSSAPVTPPENKISNSNGTSLNPTHTEDFEAELEIITETVQLQEKEDVTISQSTAEDTVRELEDGGIVHEMPDSSPSTTGNEDSFDKDEVVDIPVYTFGEIGSGSFIQVNDPNKQGSEGDEDEGTNISADDGALASQEIQAVSHNQSSIASSTAASVAVDADGDGPATETAGLSDTLMELPDEVIIDALFTNLDIVQDELELCEEGLREKLIKIRRDSQMQKAMTYVNDGRGPTDERGNSAKITGEKDEVHNVPENNDYTHQDDGDEETQRIQHDMDNDELDDDEDANKYDVDLRVSVNSATAKHLPGASPTAQVTVDPKANIKVSRKCQSSLSHDLSDKSLNTPERFAHIVVNRLTQRLGDLKQSLVQCYVMYNRL